MEFHAKLAMLCESKRFTNSDLARASGASKAAVGSWMAGTCKPTLDAALRVARVLGVSLDYLADDSQDGAIEAVVLDDEFRSIIAVVESLGPHEALDRLLLKKGIVCDPLRRPA